MPSSAVAWVDVRVRDDGDHAVGERQLDPPADEVGVALVGRGGDARVFHAGEPQRLVALHPLAAGEAVHQRVLEGMAEVQRPVTSGGGMTMYGCLSPFASARK